jgi:hypothetical protein
MSSPFIAPGPARNAVLSFFGRIAFTVLLAAFALAHTRHRIADSLLPMAELASP